MREPKDSTYLRDKTLLLGIFILFLFSAPLLNWLTSSTNAWYHPYLLWLGIILVIAWVHRRRHEP